MSAILDFVLLYYIIFYVRFYLHCKYTKNMYLYNVHQIPAGPDVSTCNKNMKIIRHFARIYPVGVLNFRVSVITVV